jgi:hypothetical protein
MLDPEKTSLLCPRNDLESDTILKLAETLHLDVHLITGQWGLTLERAFEQLLDLSALREQVIIVEIPDKTPDKRLHARLRALGKIVHEVDHHAYNGEKPLSALSSLEQFAQLMNHKLSDEQMKIAINDRDYLMGLSQLGASWEEAESLRKREWEIRGQAEAMKAAIEFVRENARDFEGDVRLILSPEKYSGVMLEAAQFPSKDEYEEASKYKSAIVLKTVLVLHYREENNTKHIYQVEFAGAAKYKDALTELSKTPQLQTDFDFWQGGGEAGCFFGANEKHTFARMDALISDLLDICLYAGRALRHYGCTFYLPLDLFLDEDLENLEQDAVSHNWSLLKKPDHDVFEEHLMDIDVPLKTEKELDEPIGQERQAYMYLLPHIRDLVFKTKQKPSTTAIHHYRLKKIDNLQWSLTPEKEPVITARVTDVSLYSYFNGLYVLAVTVKPEAACILSKSAAKEAEKSEASSDPSKSEEKTWIQESSLSRDDVTWWHDLVFSSAEEFAYIQALQLQKWLHFTNQIRILYPSFVEQLKENKMQASELKISSEQLIAFKKTDKFSPIVLHWIKQFFKDDRLMERLQFLPEDRMFVSVAYGLSGLAPKTDRQHAEVKRLFSLALYVDHKAGTFNALDNYAYDPDFTRKLMEQHSLHRWQKLGTHLGFCGYANAYLGFGWFFSDVIAPSHVPFFYGRMLLLSLFYQNTLRHFNRRVSRATRALSEQKESKYFRMLRKDFILFTNNYWFREVSSQIQGIEIFELQTKAVGLEKEYALIKDEMERADEYAVTLRTERFNDAALLFASVTLIVTVLTVDGSDEYFTLLTDFVEEGGLFFAVWLVLVLPLAVLVWSKWSKPKK